MRAVIADAIAGRGARDQLQAAAREFVRDLRHSQTSPEATLLQIKSVLAEAGLHPSYSPAEPESSLGPEARLYRDVIAWSIKAYYEDQ